MPELNCIAPSVATSNSWVRVSTREAITALYLHYQSFDACLRVVGCYHSRLSDLSYCGQWLCHHESVWNPRCAIHFDSWPQGQPRADPPWTGPSKVEGSAQSLFCWLVRFDQTVLAMAIQVALKRAIGYRTLSWEVSLCFFYFSVESQTKSDWSWQMGH